MKVIVCILCFVAEIAFAEDEAISLLASGHEAELRHDFRSAALTYCKGADRGDPAAEVALATLYRKGAGVRENLERAMTLYRLAAEKGDVSAKMYLKLFSTEKFEGLFPVAKARTNCDEAIRALSIIENDITGHDELLEYVVLGKEFEDKGDFMSAIHQYKIAADKGHMLAKIALAFLYRDGRGVKRDIDRAMEFSRSVAIGGNRYGKILYDSLERTAVTEKNNAERNDFLRYEKMASAGDKNAQYKLGVLYQNGTGVKLDYSKALELYTLSATQGNSDAQYNLGYMYANAQGTSKDYKKSFDWYKKAADLDDAAAMYNLGFSYAHGLGVEESSKSAFKWYQMAANKGDADAQYSLGKEYERGVAVPGNSALAIAWYEKAAAQNHPQALNRLGVINYDGDLVAKNVKAAFALFDKAANLGNSEAQYRLGDMYYRAESVSKNIQLAMSWYGKSAEQGYAKAQNKLGLAYYHGVDLKKDLKKSIDLFSSSASLGLPDAQLNLGVLYEKGFGVKKDLKLALELYLKSANQGFAAAQVAMGNMYAYSIGVEKDIVLATSWYKKAAAQGDANAVNQLSKLMTESKENERRDNIKRGRGVVPENALVCMSARSFLIAQQIKRANNPYVDPVSYQGTNGECMYMTESVKLTNPVFSAQGGLNNAIGFFYAGYRWSVDINEVLIN